MFNYREYNVFLACGSTDMRKSTNGLCSLVQYQFEMDPAQKILFVFCNKSRNRIKMLVWEDNGFWVHFKRIEKGTVIWPETIDDMKTMNISLDELKNLINAPGVKQKIKRQSIW